METLKKTEERFMGFLESAPDAIVIVDTEGKIQLLIFKPNNYLVTPGAN